MTEFCDAEQLFNIRNVAGQPLSDVGEMMLESDPVYGPAPSFDAPAPRLSKPAGLVDPGSGRDDHLRHGVRCAIGVRGAHCIKFSTRTDQGLL